MLGSSQIVIRPRDHARQRKQASALLSPSKSKKRLDKRKTLE